MQARYPKTEAPASRDFAGFVHEKLKAVYPTLVKRAFWYPYFRETNVIFWVCEDENGDCFLKDDRTLNRWYKAVHDGRSHFGVTYLSKDADSLHISKEDYLNNPSNEFMGSSKYRIPEDKIGKLRDSA